MLYPLSYWGVSSKGIEPLTFSSGGRRSVR
jgi:hypothetical protein